jgi:methyltransferase
MAVAGRRLAVAFPDTVLEEQDSLRDKTTKIGQIARTCSIFGVDSIEVFRDPCGKGESSLIRHVLEYLETPQYLRRRLFPLDESLRFAGLLPPLRIPSHKPKVPLDKIKPGEVREGVILPDGSTADIGLDTPVRLPEKLGGNLRVTIRVVSVSPLAGVVVDRSEATDYWGYTVEVRSVDEVMTDSRFDFKVATSRLGDPLGPSLPSLRQSFARSKGALLIFGSPARGLFDIVKNVRQRVGFVVNLYPVQNVVTVRMEEAMASGLYLLQLLTALENTKV